MGGAPAPPAASRCCLHRRAPAPRARGLGPASSPTRARAGQPRRGASLSGGGRGEAARAGRPFTGASCGAGGGTHRRQSGLTRHAGGSGSPPSGGVVVIAVAAVAWATKLACPMVSFAAVVESRQYPSTSQAVEQPRGGPHDEPPCGGAIDGPIHHRLDRRPGTTLESPRPAKGTSTVGVHVTPRRGGWLRRRGRRRAAATSTACRWVCTRGWLAFRTTPPHMPGVPAAASFLERWRCEPAGRGAGVHPQHWRVRGGARGRCARVRPGRGARCVGARARGASRGVAACFSAGALIKQKEKCSLHHVSPEAAPIATCGR